MDTKKSILILGLIGITFIAVAVFFFSKRSFFRENSGQMSAISSKEDKDFKVSQENENKNQVKGMLISFLSPANDSIVRLGDVIQIVVQAEGYDSVMVTSLGYLETKNNDGTGKFVFPFSVPEGSAQKVDIAAVGKKDGVVPSVSDSAEISLQINNGSLMRIEAASQGSVANGQLPQTIFVPYLGLESEEMGIPLTMMAVYVGGNKVLLKEGVTYDSYDESIIRIGTKDGITMIYPKTPGKTMITARYQGFSAQVLVEVSE